MPLPVTEVVIGPAPEAFRANPRDVSIVKPAYDLVTSRDGLIKAYYGIQHEDKATSYGFYVWDALEKHHEYMDDKVDYPPMIKEIAAIFELSALNMFHVRTKKEPFKALEAPAVEVATFTLREGHTLAELETIVDDFVTLIGAAPASSGVVDAVAGPVVEKPDTYLLIIGWTSVEAHYEFVKNDTAVPELKKKIDGISDLGLVHTQLTLYTK